MKAFHLIICLGIVAVLIWLNRIDAGNAVTMYGGLSWISWASIGIVVFGICVLILANDSARAFGFFRSKDTQALPPPDIRVLTGSELRELNLDKYRGPAYPHPIIFPERCIGCQACVDACPHDVLAIVDGVAAAVAPDLCMEDTACQAECPVNPKACIVINTTKEVRSLPTPTRDGASFETNVPGCYIIGDVSGVPLIKNAVKEGADVISRIAADLQSAQPEPKADLDVAIIGIGPGGASAASAASDAGLRYVGIEQGKTLSTIDLYPKGKYIFFKPDTKDWSGGIPVLGLGLSKAKYGGGEPDDDQPIIDTLGAEMTDLVHAEASLLNRQLEEKIPAALRDELSPKLAEKLEKELKKRIVAFVRSKGSNDWTSNYRTHFVPAKDELLTAYKAEITDQLQTKIPGDQRENILDIWLGTLDEKGVTINEEESCKAVKRAEDGDYFVIETERGNEKSPQTYKARRVIIAIGLRGAPNKLRLPNEDLKVSIDGREEQKVIYGLSNPMDFKGKHLIVVGGGNVAVEAAVDLIAVRDGASITPRKPEEMNKVTVLVRDYLAPTVKFGNKFQLYQCAEDGLLDLHFGVGIREMTESEVVIENVTTKEVVATIRNHYIFALIGGERPNRFLESIGITIK
ncbi:MAG: NAD(P)-binding domain-containing protein [Chloracidobacterium sp.]|nr:NAD(P)-binding domain-containing protein [Chloracidobacterium sp.]